MSVRGEFKRVAAELARFLHATGEAECGRTAATLDACVAEADDDLSTAARRALSLCQGPAPAGLDATLRAEHRERCEHTAAICRALLGAG